MRGQVSRALSQFRKSSNSRLYLVMYLLISALVADAVIVSVSDFLQDQIVSPAGTVLFMSTGFIFIIGQYVILQYIKRKTRDVRSKFHYLDTLHKIVTVIQYSLCGIFILVILEMLIGSRYHLANLIAVSKLCSLYFCSGSICDTIIQMVSFKQKYCCSFVAWCLSYNSCPNRFCGHY